MVGIITQTDGYSMDIDGTPFMCPGCPFAGESVEPYDKISNDITEAHYPCSLLNEVVWGEYSPCTRQQWQERARVELEKLRV